MFTKNKSNKEKTNKDKNYFQVNRVVIESYLGKNNNKNNKTECKTIKVNNNVYNIKNIDNNMSHGNLNENVSQSSFKNLVVQYNNEICNQTNFNLVSHIKSFNLPLLISNYSLNYKLQMKEQKKNNPELKQFIEHKYQIISSNLFIEKQRLNSCNIQITNSSKNGNLLHREITHLKNRNNKNDEIKVENNNEEIEKNNLLNSLDYINKRWNENQKVYKMRLSYINKCETLLINLDKYKQNLISKINFETVNSKNMDNCYILFKQDLQTKNNKIDYHIINSTSKSDFDISFNKFVNNTGKENDANISNSINKDETVLNSNKKKSKFNITNSSPNHRNFNGPFSPLLICNYLELKNVLNNIEKDLKLDKDSNINKKQYLLENIISFNCKGIDNKKNIPIEIEKENSAKTKELFPTKVQEHKFIILPKNIEKNNISEENNINEIKTKDFGQSTPISLLKEKYFVYAVSKWSKYSIINSEINIYIKYHYKAGHPKFDTNILKANNFYLRIEKIKLEEEPKKSRNTPNLYNFKKTLSTTKVTTKTNIENSKNQYTKTSKNSNNKFNYNDITVNIRKKSKSKPKLDKRIKK